jgi:hypothetical protein
MFIEYYTKIIITDKWNIDNVNGKPKTLKQLKKQLYFYSMNNTAASFIAKSTIKAADLEHRRKINFNIGKYNAVVPIGKQQFSNVLNAKEQAKNIKWDAIEHLDTYLEEFEKNYCSWSKSNLGRGCTTSIGCYRKYL